MRSRLSLFVALICLCLIGGCSASSSGGRSISWNPDIAAVDSFWQIEADQYFHRPCLVFGCHGSTRDAEWVCRPAWMGGQRVSVVLIMQILKAIAEPGQPVIITACNPDGIEVHGLPGVYYAKMDVWNTPGARWRWTGEAFERCAGRLSEFVEAK